MPHVGAKLLVSNQLVWNSAYEEHEASIPLQVEEPQNVSWIWFDGGSLSGWLLERLPRHLTKEMDLEDILDPLS